MQNTFWQSGNDSNFFFLQKKHSWKRVNGMRDPSPSWQMPLKVSIFFFNLSHPAPDRVPIWLGKSKWVGEPDYPAPTLASLTFYLIVSPKQSRKATAPNVKSTLWVRAIAFSRCWWPVVAGQPPLTTKRTPCRTLNTNTPPHQDGVWTRRGDFKVVG